MCRCCSSSSVSYILSKAPWQQPATATFISAAPPLRRRRAAPSTSPPTARAPARWWGWAGAVRATAVSGRPLRPSPSRRQTATRGAPHAAAAAKRGWASRGRSKITAVSSARGGAAALYASLLSTRGGESRQRQAGPAQRLRFALGRKTVTAVSTAVRNKSKRPVSRTQSGVSRTCGAFRSGAGGPCRGYASCLTLLSSPPPPPSALQKPPRTSARSQSPQSMAHASFASLAGKRQKLSLFLADMAAKWWWSTGCARFCLTFVPIRDQFWVCKGHTIPAVLVFCQSSIGQAYF